MDGKFDFTKLAPFDIYDDYRLHRFFSARSTVTLDKKKSKLHVEVRYDVHPTFTKVKASDGYRLTVIGVFPDLKKKTAHTIDVASPVRKLVGGVTPFITQLDIPSKAKEYVLCLKVEACINGVVSNTRTTTALCVINGGTL